MPTSSLFMLVAQRYRKQQFSFIEFATLFLATVLFAVPIYIVALLMVVPYAFISIPIIITLSAGAFIVYRVAPLCKLPENVDWVAILLFIALLLFISSITHAYIPLPDYDPYTWIGRYQEFLATYKSGIFAPPSRAGFFGILFLYNHLLGIGLDTLMKHGLPLLYATTLFPIWMVAKKVTNIWVARVAMMTIPFWSASTILYATTSMPQAFFIIAMVFAVMFISYARIQHQRFYYYVAGAIFFACMPIYEVSLIPFYIWAGATIWYNRIPLYAYVKKHSNPAVILLAIFLGITNISRFHQPLFFLQLWITRIYRQILTGSTNFQFPASYVNVDGNAVGWHGSLGVFEYYAYYVGAPVIILLCTGVALLFSSRWRKNIKEELRKNSESIVIFITFIAFFAISEIIPRLINLALLPERAWIFGGLCTAYGMVLFYRHASFRITTVVSVVIVIATIPSVGAALYINNEKKFFIPPYEITSAQWITSHLPDNRIVVSDGNANLLDYYGKSKTITLSDLYCNGRFANPKALQLSLIEKNNTIDNEKNAEAQEMIKSIQEYVLNSPSINVDTIDSIARKYIAVIGSTKQELLHAEYYIYYAANDPKNPYLYRPYAKSRNLCDTFIFDQHPEHYQRVYQDGNNVIIWKIL